MNGSHSEGSGVRVPDPSDPSAGRALGATRVGLALLSSGLCLLLLVWSGRGGYSVVETYGGLGGGWAQFLVVLSVGAGVVVGGCLVVVARLLDRATRARRLVPAGIALALVAVAVGATLGSLAHSAAADRAAHACDDPVGQALLSFAEELEPGPVVIQDGELTYGRDDGQCLVAVNVARDADVSAEIARVAAANGWSHSHDRWLSPDGVSMTYDVTYEHAVPAAWVELQGRRAGPP